MDRIGGLLWLDLPSDLRLVRLLIRQGPPGAGVNVVQPLFADPPHGRGRLKLQLEKILQDGAAVGMFHIE